MMRIFYNGYNFSNEAEALIYNPTLALYFLKHFQKRCQYPRRILDTNLAMDKGKITYISLMPNGGQLVIDALDNNHQVVISELYDRFGLTEVLQMTKNTQFMASLLYYFGVLTLGGYTEKGELILRIPNLVVQKLYVERIREVLLPQSTARDEAVRVAKLFCQTGNMQPLCQFIEQSCFKVFDNRDYRWTSEFTIKTAFLILLFDDTFYVMDSEASLGRGCADLTMLVRPDMRRYQLLDFLIEFKYVSLKKVELSGEQVRQLSVSELSALEPVKEKLAESKTQLGNYRQVLFSRYGEKLRLRT